MDQDKIFQLLHLIEQNSEVSNKAIAEVLAVDVKKVTNTIKELEEKGIIAGQHTMVNWDKTDDEKVSAVIELNVNLSHDTSYEQVAQTIYRFTEVESLYLMSGTYDYMVITRRASMKNISQFVNKLASMEEVFSTATHIIMNRYKDHNVIYAEDHGRPDRLVISQ